MKHLKQYFKQWYTHYQARQWLNHNNPDQIAAFCLFKLNQKAKNANYERKQFLYTCKNHLLRLFYERGYCVEVTKQFQGLRCWHTWEFNNGDDDYCYKCDNTGWYRKHHLYRFVFSIGGTRYIWHQPESLVTWPVVLTDETVGDYQEYHAQSEPFQVKVGNIYRATLYQYLLRQGVTNLPSIIKFNDALKADYRLYLSPSRKWWQLKNWYHTKIWRLLSWAERQAELKIGDKAINPYKAQVKVINIDWDYWYGDYAIVEYYHAAPPIPTGKWPTHLLTPNTMRARLARKALPLIRKFKTGVCEDEIPF